MKYFYTRSKFTQDGEFDYAIAKAGKVELEVFGRVGTGDEGKRDAGTVAQRVVDFLNGEDPAIKLLCEFVRVSDAGGDDWDFKTELEKAHKLLEGE